MKIQNRHNASTVNFASMIKSMLFIIDFKSLFNVLVSSSLQIYQIRFQVWKLGVNVTKKFASSFQCLNFYCKPMFIVQVETTELTIQCQWKVLGPVVYQEGLYFIELIIACEHLFTNEVQTLK